MNKKGSTLVLLIIVIALVIVLGSSVLGVVVQQYEIKSFNTDSKQSFYLSETGLNEAYVKSCELIKESIIKAVQMTEEYLVVNPLNEIEGENIFITNYKLNIKGKINNRIIAEGNPSVEICNSDALIFIGNTLKVSLKSTYIHDSNVEKLMWVELIISVPEFEDVMDGVYDASDYIMFRNWNS